MTEKIAVTGASGFIASHIVIDLVNAGYHVVGTVRDLQRTVALRQLFERHCQHPEHVAFAEADLTSADGWTKAIEGCDGVFHVASPAPVIQPKDASELIVPARDGTLHVLAAARTHGIRRVVLTSSVSAVSSGVQRADNRFTANDWSNLADKDVSAYDQSKTIAERAAWDFVRDGGPELVAINPAMVFGPALEPDYGSSLEVLVKLLTGEIPLIPRLGLGIVDVRDVAALHRLAWETPAAAGNRYLCSAGFRWLSQVATTLREHFPDNSKRIPRREMPSFLLSFFALFFKELASVASEIDKISEYDCGPAGELGWHPASPEDAIIAGAQSLIDLGLA